MKVILVINSSNIGTSTVAQVADILHRSADKLLDLQPYFDGGGETHELTVVDVNGNKVGYITIEQE